jgi:peptidyl-prolyl cis-trans isomerase C
MALAKKLIEQIYEQARANSAWDRLSLDSKIKLEEPPAFNRGDYVTGVGSQNEFAGVAFALQKPGDISPIVETERSYYIIQLVEKYPYSENAYTSERDELQEQLLQEKQNKVYVNWFTQLRENAEIEDHREIYFY